jgi:hypothetical protein
MGIRLMLLNATGVEGVNSSMTDVFCCVIGESNFLSSPNLVGPFLKL